MRVEVRHPDLSRRRGERRPECAHPQRLASSDAGEDQVVLRPALDVVAELRGEEPGEGTGEVRLRDLVKESLRMRPSRVIVGEVRAEECLDLSIVEELHLGLPWAQPG